MEGIDDFLLRKAREIVRRLPAGELSSRLRITADLYEAALSVQAVDPGRVDRLADDLEDLIVEGELELES